MSCRCEAISSLRNRAPHSPPGSLQLIAGGSFSRRRYSAEVLLSSLAMGGIFGKNKRPCVFPKRVVFHKAKGKKTSETVRVFCDASTWTGENHFQSARIGRTPKGPELPAPKLVLDAPELQLGLNRRQESKLHLYLHNTVRPPSLRLLETRKMLRCHRTLKPSLAWR